jgi:hypothetical protein
MQDRNTEKEIQTITRKLNRLRICKDSFNKDFNRREKRLLDQLASVTHVDLSRDNQTVLASHNSDSETSSIPDLEAILTIGSSDPPLPVIPSFVPSRPLVFDATDAYLQLPYPAEPTFEAILSPKDIQVGDRVRITNRLSHVKGRSTTEEDTRGTITKINLVHIRLVTDSGIDTSRIRKNLEKEVSQE